MHPSSNDNSGSHEQREMQYRSMTDQDLPMRQFAPELFGENMSTFDEKTDIWAYGLTLIELYQLGDAPYQNLNPRQPGLLQRLRIFLLSTRVHPKPLLCPDVVYDRIIVPCFSERSERPTFHQVAQELESIKTDSMEILPANIYEDSSNAL